MHRMIGFLLSGLLLAGALMAQAKDAGVWLNAYRAYLQQEYAPAHEGFTLLLQGTLTAAEREELLWQDAHCLLQLDRAADAAKTMETLLRLVPDSPYETIIRPLLYQCYLRENAQEQAGVCWTDTIERWKDSPYLWDFLRVHLDMTARYAPDKILRCAEPLARLSITDARYLTPTIYRPLLAAGRMTEAQALHARLQQRLSEHDQQLADLDQQAYDDALTREMVDGLISRCRDAVQAGDLETARIWLDHINMLIPEYPQAAEMRALFNAKVKELRKD